MLIQPPTLLFSLPSHIFYMRKISGPGKQVERAIGTHYSAKAKAISGGQGKAPQLHPLLPLSLDAFWVISGKHQHFQLVLCSPK